MVKIHIQTNFHENSPKIDGFIGKNRQKTTVANLYGGYFICPYCQKSGFKLPITVFGFFSQYLNLKRWLVTFLRWILADLKKKEAIFGITIMLYVLYTYIQFCKDTAIKVGHTRFLSFCQIKQLILELFSWKLVCMCILDIQ